MAGMGWVQGAASQLADLFAGSGDKIFGALGFGRFLLLAWLIMQLWDRTHGWCFAGLLLAILAIGNTGFGLLFTSFSKNGKSSRCLGSCPWIVLNFLCLKQVF